MSHPTVYVPRLHHLLTPSLLSLPLPLQQLKASQQEDAGKEATKISVSLIMPSHKGSNRGGGCTFKKHFGGSISARELGQKMEEKKKRKGEK